MTFKFDTTQFNAALRQTVMHSGRAAADVVNGHALAVAIAAVRLTEKANKEQIQHTLGQIGNALNYTKKGDRLKKRSKGQAMLVEDSFAARIINARRRDAGEQLLHGDQLNEAARKLIAARARSVGFIKSGWVWAIRDLYALTSRKKKAITDKDAIKGNKRMGKGTPASGGGVFGSGKFNAMIENTSLIQSGGRTQAPGLHNPLAVAERGLQLAMESEIAEMKNHLIEKMNEAFKKGGSH